MRTDLIKPNGPAIRSALFQWASGVYTTRGIEGFYRPRKFAQQQASGSSSSNQPGRRSFFWQGFGSMSASPPYSPSPSSPSSQPESTSSSLEDFSEAEKAAQQKLWPPLVGMFLFGLFKHPLTPMRGMVCDTQHLAGSLRHNCGGDLTFQGAATFCWGCTACVSACLFYAVHQNWQKNLSLTPPFLICGWSIPNICVYIRGVRPHGPHHQHCGEPYQPHRPT